MTQLAHEHGPGRRAGQTAGAGCGGTAPAGVSIAEYTSAGQSEDALGPTRKRKKGDEAHWGCDVSNAPLR